MSILVIAPHPDDESIGCGGAIRLHSLVRGERVFVAFLTSGERGLKIGEDEARRIREREAEAAAEVLGVDDIAFLRLPDTRLADCHERVSDALRPLLRRERPARVYVPHPADGHTDHAGCATVLWAALGGEAADSPTVLGYEVWSPMPTYDDGADITPVMADKLRAVRCHRSQVSLLAYDRGVRGLNAFRGALAWKCRYAEVYQHLFPPAGCGGPR